jgi:hypothetical protein
VRAARLLWPALAVCAMAVSGCGGGSGNAAAEPVAPAEPPAEVDAADFATARFSESTTVDNDWFPLRPGTRHVYEGSSVEDGERLQHRVVFTVTDLTKMVAGVEAVVVWERDYTSGELVEAELVFLAQDDGGNVWHLGQYPEEYENGRFAKTPTWIAGVRGARAGVYIRAEAREGADYSQGYAPPPINWVDRAHVSNTGTHTCVPAGCFDDVVIVSEYETGKPDAYQLKYYAPGVGNVRVGWKGSKEDSREVLVLTERRQLSAEQLADARAAALELERDAYRRSPAVYGTTAPAR